MTDNTSSHSYSFYSFPQSPNRHSPRSTRSHSISSNVSGNSHPGTSHRASSYTVHHGHDNSYNVSSILYNNSTSSSSKNNMPSPAAGKGDAPRTPTKLGRKPQVPAPKLNKPQVGKSEDAPTPDMPEQAEDLKQQGEEKVEDTKSQAQDTAEDTQEKGEEAKQDPQGAAQDAGNDAQQGAQETAEDVQDTAESTAEGAQDTAESAKDTAESKVDDAKSTVQDTADDVQSKAQDTTDGATDAAQGATPDLSLLKGLEVDEEGLIKNQDGRTVGRLVEGDAEDLAGYPIGDNGEILDDDGDLVGRCELTPEMADEQLQGASGKMPDISVLKGLTADRSGQILNEDGDFVGHLVEGDPSEIQGREFNENGEILDDDGNVIAKAELSPEAADLPAYQNEDDEDQEGEEDDAVEGITDKAQQAKDDVKDTAEDAAEGAKDDVEEKAAEVEDELPGVEALEGMEINTQGEILNDDGDVVGNVADGDLENIEDVKGLTVNDKGEVVDKDGNVLGQVELAEGAADKLKESAAGALDTRILDGLKVNKKGKILDSDGEEIGELTDGDLSQCAGKKVNEKGEVLDKDGKVIGKVDVVAGEAAFNAIKELKEQLGETEEPEEGDVEEPKEGDAEEPEAGDAEEEEGEPEMKEITPEIDELEGFKVNKKGQVLDEEGEPIGELVEGDAAKCAGKKINEKGEVVDKDGNVLGKVKALPKMVEASEVQEPEVKEVEVIPEINELEGLKVNKKGQVLDEEGEPIGELVEGDAAECAGKKINEKGEVLDKDGNVIGKVKTLPKMVEQQVGQAEEAAENAEDAADDAQEAAEDAQEAAEDAELELDEDGRPPLSILDGLKCNKSGKLIDSNGNIVGELVEGDAKKLSKSGTTCDAEGQFWDNKGKVIGRAQTIPQEEGEEEAPFAGLDGLVVVKDGFVEDDKGNRVGQVVEGDAKKLVGRAVDEDGDILDKKGSVVGHAERYEEPEEEAQEEEAPEDLSILAGRTVNKQGNVIGDQGVPIARLVEGNPKELAGRKIDENGLIFNDTGKQIGRCELIPENERESKPEGIFAGLEGLRVIQGGMVADEDDNTVGRIVEGNPKRLVGMAVDEDGDILDKYGNVKGHAEPLEDEEEEEPADLSILDGLTLNKQGYLVNAEGIPVGKLVEGNLGELAGRKSDGEGLIHGDTGKVVGRCELIPPNERPERKEGPFAGFEGLRVVKDGFVEDNDGNRVGQLTEGDAKRLVGHTVDEDGDIIDKYGNVKGHAEPWEEEEEEVDLSALAGCTVNKAGNVVDSSGTILGRVAEGDPATLAGKKVDGKGQIWDNEGNVIGRAELVHGQKSGPEGPFAGFDDATVAKDGTIQTPSGEIIGRVTEGDVKKLAGHKVDEDGDINDKNGNVIGKAERWEPEEKERRINPMSGMRVNKEGEVRDENGDILGRLTAGDLGHCAGLEIDDNGYVVDNDGNKVGEVTLLENIQEEEEIPEDETDEERQRREDAELAKKMSAICEDTLQRVQPVMKQITEYIEQADRTPRDELDEEELVNNVKPLIEEGSRILNDCNGSLRGLDPDGRIAAQAKGRQQTGEASPEEYKLADNLKELTTTVVTTIDNAKKKISDMPHAKKKLNPLWALLTEPLFQIIAAVGLLLTGVLNLVGRLLNGLGLGGLVNGLLGGLGINKLLGGLGLGGLTDMLGGKDDKKKKKGGSGPMSMVGGLLGKK
ncbi:LEA domain-containing [Pyrenophora seminiperda CCB06]|uniref:LEA domain-containing n=1 Tax=Pyrenophora seminiperda CCB06 TaxID=1302712 RepID=A0A3M7LWZ3_9PLEO|nr:LEA domain-containing [Pyrenophora seminiperda CCB06]